MKHIESPNNPRIKDLLKLQTKAKVRQDQQQFVVEGVREIGLALQSGYTVVECFYCKNLLSSEALFSFLGNYSNSISITSLSSKAYEKLAYRASTEGLIALIQQKDHRLDAFVLKTKNPLLLVAESPEKPGNIGALLRTADAASLDGVLIANPKTDLYNSNVIRSSVGGIFTTPVAMGSTSEIIKFLKQRKISIYAASLQSSLPYTDVSFEAPTALVVGTEAEGLTHHWLENASQNIHIPMEGKIDSMNVSVAAAVLIFEAKRQRKLN